MNRTVDTNAQSVRHLENLHGRHGADAGVILVQVDQLARINHSAGTETGNALLDEVARRLETFAADEFGHGSFVGRLEGPRFLIVPAVPLSLGALRAQERALHVALAEPMVGDPNGRLAIRIVTALITRDEIMLQLYAWQDEPDAKIIDVYICRIRAKLAAAGATEDLISTSFSQGYRLSARPSEVLPNAA